IRLLTCSHCSGFLMPLILSDAGLAVVTAVAGRLPLRLRGAFLQELAAAFAGHEGEGLHRLAVEAARRGVESEAAESGGSVVPAAHRAERRRLVERLRALQAEARGSVPTARPRQRWCRRVRRCGVAQTCERR